ncbi:anti-sigma-K factor RskA [Agromyces sp. 3263]|uniref:anti-sigma factor n=1 Tax=Agromyces sp. 3263 TaxID=2817750 RepID=UPI00285B1FE3|nr:anti-sigma factor [Agromyces sp. 3263]MDR6906827.1 anti-sigma-K factor RskA [Agromyces sp. 3263]
MSDDQERPDDGSDRRPASVEAYRGLAAAYALDALDPDERVAFERVLADSAELREEVDAYARSASHLAEQTEAVTPPPSLKAGLMAALDRTPQQSPGQPRAHVASAPVTAAASVPDAAPVPDAAAVDASTPAPAAPPSVAGPVESAAHRRWFQRPVALIASAAAAVVLITGIVLGVGWSGPNGWGAQREMAAIASAPDAQSQTHEVPGGGEITLVTSAAKGRSGVVVDGLPPLEAGQTYELWYIDDSGAAAAGTFDANGGETWRVLDGSFSPGVAVGVTVEPEGGSAQPTTDPIVVIAT